MAAVNAPMAAMPATAASAPQDVQPAAPLPDARLIHGHGTPEAAWRASPLLRDMPRATFDGLVGDAPRLVVVAPHPDDEVLGCGGLIADAVRRGRDVVVVAVTDGEHCYPALVDWPPATLAAIRRAELVAAVARLGLPDSAVHAIAIADGGVRGAGVALADALHALLRADDLALVTWVRDGHPDHEGSAEALLDAAARRGTRVLQYPVWAWHWMPADAAGFAAAHALRFDLDDALCEAKAAAIACFPSQLGHGPVAAPEPILPAHVAARFARPFEVYLA